MNYFNYALLLITSWQNLGFCAFVSLRSDELSVTSGRMNEDPSNTSLFGSNETGKHLESLRTDEISLVGEDIKKLPAYQGGLLSDFLEESGRKKTLPPIPKSLHQKETQEDVYGGTQSHRVRRAVSDQEITDPPVGSEWGEWSECSSDNCEEGIRRRMKSCRPENVSESGESRCEFAAFRTENMVQEKTCYADGCVHSNATRRSEWTSWSACDVTCGAGSQTRVRSCLSGGRSDVAIEDDTCNDVERRKCQHQASCPIWDAWEMWSACSQSCGGGFIIRKRNCVIYRFHSTANTDELLVQDEMQTEEINADTFTSEPNPETDNATIPTEDFAKEMVHRDLCLKPNEGYEELLQCNSGVPCSYWALWGEWSSCHRRCIPGIKRRERQCIKNNKEEPCSTGSDKQYMKCYPPPCWGEWTTITECSVSCGRGQKRRARTCNIYSDLPPYDVCEGENEDVVTCYLPACEDVGTWANWSDFTPCTRSCGRGFTSRQRTCLTNHCFGRHLQILGCNRQRCPIWGKWGDMSCCNSTCGPGYANRTRECFFGSTCKGELLQLHKCHSRPCEQGGNDTEIKWQCGTKPQKSFKRSFLKIVNGKEASPHAWPWQGSWQARKNTSVIWKHICGASLIHPRWVLTAAHCYEIGKSMASENLQTVAPNRDNWSMLFGIHDVTNSATRTYIYKIYNHDKYRIDVGVYNDITLIKLTSFVKISETVMPICMPGILKPAPGEICVATGWGQIHPDSVIFSDKLLEANIPAVDIDDCRRLGPMYNDFLREDQHMCAGMITGNISDTCPGDSGGPLACKNGSKWYLAGVTSFSFGLCGSPGHAGVYAKVSSYQKWIMQTIKDDTYDDCSPDL